MLKIPVLACGGGGIVPQIQFSWQTLLPNEFKTLALIFICLILSFRSNAQLPCFEVTNQCAGFDPAVWESFKCIEGPVKVSDLIFNNLLLSQIDAPATLQRIVVKGTLTVDISTASGGYTFAEGSSIILNDQNSEIVIDPDCQLTLDKTGVAGCFTMWKNILVSEGGSLIVKNGCSIFNGIYAIYALPNSSISITDNVFSANFAAITIGSESTGQQMPINFIPNGGIWGNQIIGGNLKVPYVGKKSLVGIQIGNISDVLIGSLGHNSNVISNLVNSFGSAVRCNGISAVNSKVTVRNTKLSDIGTPPNSESVDDAALAGISGSKIILFGFGSNSNTIEYGNTGVYLSNSSAEIYDSKFKDNEVGVIHFSSKMSAPSSLKVKDCIIEGFNEKGIWARGAVRLSTFEIKNCTFDDNRELAGFRQYLTVDPTSPIDGKGFSFWDNKFYFRSRSVPPPIGVSAHAVFLQNINKGEGSRNEFYDEGTTSSVRTFLGIQMSGCNNFNWINNDFFGTDGGATQHEAECCILAENAPFCKYLCNYLDGFACGMQFYGDCNSSVLSSNSFNAHSYYGIDLAENGAVIGRQFKKLNEWNGTGVFKIYSGYDPNDPMHEFQVQRSLFTIHTNNTSSAYWADPRKVENIDPDENWFISSVGGPLPFTECPETTTDPDPDLDLSERAIIEGTFLPWNGFAANTWDAAFLLYQRMTEDTTLRPVGSMEASWYFENYNHNLGKLRRVLDGLISLSTNVPTATAVQLLSDLDSITVTNTHEQNLKSDLHIFLEQYVNNIESLTPQQSAELTSIANQCRYEGGIGVVLARLVLGQPSHKEEDCPEGLERGRSLSSQESANPVNGKVFPNPAERSFNIQLDRSIQNGAIRLVDLSGRVVGGWMFSDDALNVTEANVPAGVYLLEVLEQGHILSRNKIVFSH